MDTQARGAQKARPINADFTQPAGAPSLVRPDSVQWRVFRNPIALGIGGVCAVLLEFADARIRSGVWDHSVYKYDPIGRSRRTGTAALVGVFGAEQQARALIAGVTRMHARVQGETPSGEHYTALNPHLLDWVHATAAYGFLNAYHRFVRPLSPQEQRSFYQDGEVVARLYGVVNVLREPVDFDRMLADLLPRFEPHPIVLEFLNIIRSGEAAPSVPKVLHRGLANAAVSLLPPLVRERLQLGAEWDLTLAQRLALSAAGRLIDVRRSRASPAWQAAERQGLPGEFSWLSPQRQAAILARRAGAQAAPVA